MFLECWIQGAIFKIGATTITEGACLAAAPKNGMTNGMNLKARNKNRLKPQVPGPLLQAAQKHWQKGVALSKLSDWVNAELAFEQARAKLPNETVYLLNLAWVQTKQYEYDKALANALRVVELDPDQTIARDMATDILCKQHRYAEAAQLMHQLPAHFPRTAQYFYDLGSALFNAARYKEAIGVLFEGLQHDISHALSHYRMALCFNSLDMKSEASECLRTCLALGLGPGNISAQTLLTFLEREMCRWDKAEADLEMMNRMIAELPPKAAQWTSGFACAVLCTDATLAKRGSAACANFVALNVGELPPVAPRPLPQRLRVGFVSSDMHQHATAILMAEVFEKLDRERFEVMIFSHGPNDGSPMRARLIAAADQFFEIGRRSDLEVAHQVRELDIEVLVDLKGHTKGNRLQMFAHRAAPVQVSYLGHPGTTGADYIDYFIGDAIVSPLAHEAYYTEKLALMPHCYQPNDRKRPLPKPVTRTELGLPEDALVICGFNQPFKFNREVFDVWADLMRELPDAVLWMLEWNTYAKVPMLAQFEARGIAASRIIFAPRVGIESHITRLAQADLFIDTWPCNGHTTASDAMWAGVPVVTYSGEIFASRVAGSLLHAVGLPELVCRDLASYKEKVLQLARDAALRQHLREHLVAARETADLFDSDAYTRDFGRLLWAMAERWSQGLPPESFQLEPLDSSSDTITMTDGVAS